ncbi:SRPBCC family protein [Roseinatronobacter alkalisoli]|uniref:SRPBCC family protein n=1 Tax=Roseinatronobacter alkalisoli TaxID=3028235 RepID=A0ABT5T779_9RHOB|nr:SRPBCC family protein [Roseinatronobacter sp. HJB301]MDD7970821.1 SRPBCC family protein [Roseinatronobacter sp. HJB301]
MKLDPKTDLKLERTLAAPRALLWECWTTPEHIKQFFVPHPHLVKDCEINLRIGGRFNTVFDVEGNEMKNEGVYLEIVPEEKLVFTDTYSEGWKPSENPFMTAIILLEDAPDGGTKYTAIARHRTPESRQSHEDMGFFGGWGTVLDQLEAYAKTMMR